MVYYAILDHSLYEKMSKAPVEEFHSNNFSKSSTLPQLSFTFCKEADGPELLNKSHSEPV